MNDGLGVLIISPTRELAYQTFEVLKKIGQFHDFSAGLIIGGKVGGSSLLYSAMTWYCRCQGFERRTRTDQSYEYCRLHTRSIVTTLRRNVELLMRELEDTQSVSTLLQQLFEGEFSLI